MLLRIWPSTAFDLWPCPVTSSTSRMSPSWKRRVSPLVTVTSTPPLIMMMNWRQGAVCHDRSYAPLVCRNTISCTPVPSDSAPIQFWMSSGTSKSSKAEPPSLVVYVRVTCVVTAGAFALSASPCAMLPHSSTRRASPPAWHKAETLGAICGPGTAAAAQTPVPDVISWHDCGFSCSRMYQLLSSQIALDRDCGAEHTPRSAGHQRTEGATVYFS
mmetsp:Transcript_14574/g.44056  ORF Transcript_14574/g.44056 Transcript_14574/m.44056 type:complete len:215 (-) Transcript_14574:38-682(-)